MMKMRPVFRLTVAFACAAMLTGSAFADDGDGQVTVSSDGSTSGRMGAVAFGTTTIDGKQWQRLAFQPEIPLGKLGIALDIELFLNDQGEISSRGWRFGSGEEIAETIYRKIYYIRWGQPRDPVYWRVGALDNVTLGYGFLMNGYRNTLDYPGVKNLGMEFALNGIGGINIQGMTNNFLDISRGGPVVGLRIAKPLGPFEAGVSIVYDIDQFGGMGDRDGDGYPDDIDRFPDDELTWGDTDRDGVPDADDPDADGDDAIDTVNPETGQSLTIAQQDSINAILTGAGLRPYNWDTDGTDLQELFNKNNYGRDGFGMVGADVAFKLIDQSSLRLITYGQIGMSLDDDDGAKAEGWGFAAPGLMLKLGPLEGRIEYRHLRDEFMPEYFNGLYDHTRAVADYDNGTVMTRDSTLEALDGQNLNGVFGQAHLPIGNFFVFDAQYQFLVGEDDNQQRLGAMAGLGEGALQLIPKLSRVEAFYSKNNIGLYGDGFFEKTIDMTYGYRVGFGLGGGVEVVWATQYTFTPVGADLSEVESQRQVGIQTVISF